MIDQVVTGGSVSSTQYVFFKRAGDSRRQACRQGLPSAMPGWTNFKMALGHGKTGKSLGYVTFLHGNQALLSEHSSQVKISVISYTLNNVVHNQLYTPQMTYDLYWDANYQSGLSVAGAHTSEFTVSDNATQPGNPQTTGGQAYNDYTSYIPVVTYILDYDSGTWAYNGAGSTATYSGPSFNALKAVQPWNRTLFFSNSATRGYAD